MAVSDEEMLHLLLQISSILDILPNCLTTLWARIAQSVQGLATGWMVRGSNPGGGEIFCTHPDWPWGTPSLLYNGYWAFSAGQAAGTWC